MNTLINGGAFVLLAAAVVLILAKGAVAHWRLIVAGASLLAALAMWLTVDRSAAGTELTSLAATVMLLTIAGATSVESRSAAPVRQGVCTLLSASACLILAVSPSLMSSIVACLVALVAIAANSIGGHRSSARVFFLQNCCGFVLMIAGFVAVASASSEVLGAVPPIEMTGRMWVGGFCLILGLFMASGLPPFQAGVLDLYEKADSSQSFSYTITPIHWFLALRMIQLLPPEGLSILRFALIAAIAIGSIASIRCDRKVFLCVSRSVLLAWAILLLAEGPASLGECLLSFAAYLTASAGQHAVHRLVEARIGRLLGTTGGLGRHFPKLSGFGLFFALAIAGLPITANFVGSETIGVTAATHGIGFVLVSYFALAILGISSYRNHTLIFLGPGTDAIPAGLDLKVREHLGMVTIASVSVGTTLWFWYSGAH